MQAVHVTAAARRLVIDVAHLGIEARRRRRHTYSSLGNRHDCGCGVEVVMVDVGAKTMWRSAESLVRSAFWLPSDAFPTLHLPVVPHRATFSPKIARLISFRDRCPLAQASDVLGCIVLCQPETPPSSLRMPWANIWRPRGLAILRFSPKSGLRRHGRRMSRKGTRLSFRSLV